MASSYDRTTDQHDNYLGRLLTPQEEPRDGIPHESSTSTSSPQAGPAIIEYASFNWQERAAMAQAKQDSLRTPARALPEMTLPTPESLRRISIADSPAPPRHRRARPALQINVDARPFNQAFQAAPVDEPEPYSDSPSHAPYHSPSPPLPESTPCPETPKTPFFHKTGHVYRIDCGYRDLIPEGCEECESFRKELDLARAELELWDFTDAFDDFKDKASEVEPIVGPLEVTNLSPGIQAAHPPTLQQHYPLPAISGLFEPWPAPHHDLVPFAANASSTMYPPPAPLYFFPELPNVTPFIAPTPDFQNAFIEQPGTVQTHQQGGGDVCRNNNKRRRDGSPHATTLDELEHPAKRVRESPSPTLDSNVRAIDPKPHKSRKGKGRARPRRTRQDSQGPTRIRQVRNTEDSPDAEMHTVIPSTHPAPIPVGRNLRPRKAGLSYAGMC